MLANAKRMSMLESSLFLDGIADTLRESAEFEEILYDAITEGSAIFESGVGEFHSLSESKVSSVVASFKAKMKSYRDKVLDADIDTSQIDGTVKAQAAHAIKELKGLKNTEADRKKGSDIIAKCLKDIFATITWEGILSSVAIFFLILVVNSLFMAIFMGLFGPFGGMALGAILIAPITEELGKYVAIKNGFGGEFALVFNAGEFLLYMQQLTAQGMKASHAAAVRILPVIMHYTTVVVQKYAYEKDVESGVSKEEAGRGGLIAGMLIHGLWNFMAVMQSVSQMAKQAT